MEGRISPAPISMASRTQIKISCLTLPVYWLSVVDLGSEWKGYRTNTSYSLVAVDDYISTRYPGSLGAKFFDGCLIVFS